MNEFTGILIVTIVIYTVLVLYIIYLDIKLKKHKKKII